MGSFFIHGKTRFSEERICDFPHHGDQQDEFGCRRSGISSQRRDTGDRGGVIVGVTDREKDEFPDRDFRGTCSHSLQRSAGLSHIKPKIIVVH